MLVAIRIYSKENTLQGHQKALKHVRSKSTYFVFNKRNYIVDKRKCFK